MRGINACKIGKFFPDLRGSNVGFYNKPLINKAVVNSLANGNSIPLFLILNFILIQQ